LTDVFYAKKINGHLTCQCHLFRWWQS